MADTKAQARLVEALQGFIEERESELEHYRTMLEQLKNGATAAPVPGPRARGKRRGGRKAEAGGRQRRGVGQHWIDATRDYLKRNKEARQVEIAAALKANSGTISLALRALEDAGEAEKGPIVNRAQVWKWTGKPARVTEVRPGEAVEPEKGRLAAS